MKKTSLLFAALMGMVALTSCNKDIVSENIPDMPQEQVSEGQMILSLDFPEAIQTKAVTAYTTAQTYESQVNSVQILVFDSAGKIDKYYNAGKTTSGISISTVTGAKTVWAVVNGPDLKDCAKLSDLQATALTLGGNNSITASTGFIMAGSASCTVGTSTVNCAITVSRFVSRVALVSVTNSLPASYGSLTVNCAYLSNVVGNQNMAGNASAATWYNKFGRADESTQVSSHIIDGSTYKASCPDLTYKSISGTAAVGASHTPSTPYLFYCFPNSSTTAPAAFSTSFAAQRTVLVVKATVGGTAYYYPVVLDDAAPARNSSYTVGLTITGPGSTDPNQPVAKGNMSASITVSPWASGAVYNETI